MKYIIQQGVQFGNSKNNIINVLTQQQIQDYIKSGFRYKERPYKMTSGRIQYEVICGEIWQKGDNEHSIIIPEFLITHRTYAVYIYAYAISLYSTSPEKSQRVVAEETRINFNLETFAHTTVGRAIKALAKMLKNTSVVDNGISDEECVMEQNETVQENEKTSDANYTKKIPTLLCTKVQREVIKSHFSNRLNKHAKKDFRNACECIVTYWYINFRRLLVYICTRRRM